MLNRQHFDKYFPHQSRIFPSLCPVAIQSSFGWQATQVKQLVALFLTPEPTGKLQRWEVVAVS